MKRWGKVVSVAAIAALAATGALADRGGHHGGWGGREHHEWHHHHGWGFVYFGPTLFWPGYAPPAPAIVEPPPIYIERGSPPGPATSDQLWYYCDAAGAYYPYAKECPGGWRAVVPQQR